MQPADTLGAPARPWLAYRTLLSRATKRSQLCSGIYRNKASAEALPTTYNDCSTLYEVRTSSTA